MFRDTRWDGFRAYTMLSGLVILIALILFATKNYAGLGVGGMERLVVAPMLLWASSWESTWPASPRSRRERSRRAPRS